MKQLITVKQNSTKELIIKKSRFIADIYPLKEEQEAKKIIENVRKKNPNANHVVFAYTVGLNREIQRMSDNGEPVGTAGKPVLDAITKNNLINVLITVTRYFGGIKLGAGGLIRAYSQSASQTIENAQLATLVNYDRLQLIFDYSLIDKLEYFIEKQKAVVMETNYQTKVQAVILVETSDSKNFQKRLIDLFSGRIIVKKINEELRPSIIENE
ncbi:YigZ family protein [Oenococcus oeni]|uniref:YigZ family protein n=1 Tax=Oenococcus oeni TaxID=1247 RepID=UPI0008F91ECB|nr:YigZ family protein [Oenococcus oeni]OIL34723.1 YigZ family protein [Oenococcus oeni]OLQ35665.1 YigZ family protein [Oenococcus oeni]